MEILEAGTGHGALTLFLSRAIHAANPPRPAGMSLLDFKPSSPSDSDATDVDEEEASPASSYLLRQYKNDRRAVIHSVEMKKQYSKHAEKVVRGFRRGMYADNIDFHVGDVSEWVNAELKARQDANGSVTISPFLTHAFLDLPGPLNHLRTVASALHTDGMLVVFNPSITQITDCFRKVKDDGIPLHLDKVLELGTNGSTGGREWDVRASNPRAVTSQRTPEAQSKTQAADGDVEAATEGEQKSHEVEQADAAAASTKPREWNFVCRPKVGERIVGGGFLGVFRKKNEE